jgi:hypothetical protein
MSYAVMPSVIVNTPHEVSFLFPLFKSFTNTLAWLDVVKRTCNRDIEGSERGGILGSNRPLVLPYTAIVRCKCDIASEDLVSVLDQEHLASHLGLYR